MNKLARRDVVKQEGRKSSRLRNYFRNTSIFLSERWRFRKELKTLKVARETINQGISIRDAVMDFECPEHPKKIVIAGRISELINTSSAETRDFIGRESTGRLSNPRVTNGDYFVAGTVCASLVRWTEDPNAKLALLEISARHMQRIGAYTESQGAALGALEILRCQPEDFDHKEEKIRDFFRIFVGSFASKRREMTALGLSINASIDRVSDLRVLAEMFPQFEGAVTLAEALLGEQLAHLA